MRTISVYLGQSHLGNRQVRKAKLWGHPVVYFGQSGTFTSDHAVETEDQMLVLRPNFEKRGGLVTVVAQDSKTREVLMVAYTDEAGWRKTLETGLGCYYSTSRNKSWTKGEESGNYQKVVEMRVDCDGDALIYLVEPQGDGVACHTNARTCFYRSVTGNRGDYDAPKAGDNEKLRFVEAVVKFNM